jgi:hypothetical protein
MRWWMTWPSFYMLVPSHRIHLTREIRAWIPLKMCAVVVLVKDTAACLRRNQAFALAYV